MPYAWRGTAGGGGSLFISCVMKIYMCVAKSDAKKELVG